MLRMRATMHTTSEYVLMSSMARIHTATIVVRKRLAGMLRLVSKFCFMTKNVTKNVMVRMLMPKNCDWSFKKSHAV